MDVYKNRFSVNSLFYSHADAPMSIAVFVEIKITLKQKPYILKLAAFKKLRFFAFIL